MKQAAIIPSQMIFPPPKVPTSTAAVPYALQLCSLPSQTPAEFAPQRVTSNTSIFITEQNISRYQIMDSISIFPLEKLRVLLLGISRLRV